MGSETVGPGTGTGTAKSRRFAGTGRRQSASTRPASTRPASTRPASRGDRRQGQVRRRPRPRPSDLSFQRLFLTCRRSGEKPGVRRPLSQTAFAIRTGDARRGNHSAALSAWTVSAFREARKTTGVPWKTAALPLLSARRLVLGWRYPAGLPAGMARRPSVSPSATIHAGVGTGLSRARFCRSACPGCGVHWANARDHGHWDRPVGRRIFHLR